MSQNTQGLIELSSKYVAPPEDALLIYLNLSGMRTDMPHKRVRFKLQLDSYPEVFYLGIPIVSNSPFFLSNMNKTLSLDDTRVGRVDAAENDTCDSTYFRRNGTVLVLNSYSRSSCNGCPFCATHLQDANDRVLLDTEEKLCGYIENLFSDRATYGAARPHFHQPLNSPKGLDLSHLYQVAVITACFGSEEVASSHLSMVKRCFSGYGFNGEIFYLGSEITSGETLRRLKGEILNFALCLSLECFTKRDKLLSPIKRKVSLKDYRRIAEEAQNIGIPANFTYIVGLDPLSDMEKGLQTLVPLVSRFPIFQVFQPHFETQKVLRAEGAEDIEYYLKARKMIESMFSHVNLRPRSWENYRPLWYLAFGDELLSGIRV